MKNVLFLCRTNNCLSLMAEAYMSAAGRGVWRPWSAAVEAAGDVDPQLPEFLKRVGLRKLNLYSKSWNTFAVHGAPRLDLAVLIRGDFDALSFPDLPGPPEHMTWSISSPVATEAASGGDHLLLRAFAEIRRQTDSLLLARPGLERRTA